MSYYVLLSLLVLQRLQEMSLGKKNLQKLSTESLVEIPYKEKKLMLLLHAGFFISCIIEYHLSGKLVPLIWFIPGIMVLTFCQLVRFKTMRLLGEYWTPYPLSFRNQKVVSTGPYRFVRHPNYLIVIIEILIVPLLGRCFITAGVFGLLNFIFLSHKIKMEENAMNLLPDYQKVFRMKKKLIPFLYIVLLTMNLEAATISLNTSSYDEAKKQTTWFKFSGESKKLGLFKTSFDGYARKASLSYKEGENALEDVVLEIDASALDTDNSSRDNKLREQGLSTDKFPMITVKISSIKTNVSIQEAPGEMIVRGKTLPIKITIKKGEGGSFEGSSSFRLSEAGIPDPSIAIASVNDEFQINFQVKLNP